MFNAVGGSTILYAAHFPRLHPSDFRVRSLDGVADDWPLDYATLEPYYDENDEIMGVAGLAGDPAYPPNNGRAAAAGAAGPVWASAGRGFNALGWHWWPSDSAIATRRVPYGRAPCINLGPCGPGCAQGAKGSAPTSPTGRLACARRRARHALPGARDHRRNEDGMADRRRLLRRRRRGAPPEAEVVVLACNGVGTPRCCSTRLPAVPRRPRQLERPGRAQPDVPPLRLRDGIFEERLEGYKGPHRLLHPEPGVLRDRPSTAASCAATTFEIAARLRPRSRRRCRACRRQMPWGQEHHEAPSAATSTTPRHGGDLRGPARRAHNRDAGSGAHRLVTASPRPRSTTPTARTARRMMDHALARGRGPGGGRRGRRLPAPTGRCRWRAGT